ncbi:ABC transporter family substrate-binding protein [Streptomyces sp. TS71-3]|uniref:ABC transporter family substrate-binding protein n=1 Tax=Streptomyces sp. TS71-3 TaxID=2733862 RepID=UPI001B04F132|nr:ABC transporter family substrate-binding protein [Streptomyces sp. TS71-3]GHJ39361.1 ABC transporter substrate-binding protein [Streptomyces sp. TS71-3]
MSRRSRHITLTVAAVSAALVMAGCGSSDDSSDNARKKGAAPAVDAQAINAQPMSNVRQGGRLKLSVQKWVHQYNWYQVDGTDGDAVAILEQVEPVLLPRDAKGVPHPDPNYLLSAKVTSTSPQVVTYKLNPKAKWSNGKQMGYRDFQAVWKAVNGSNDQYLVADSSGYDQISKVARGADDQEVKVTFGKPYTDWQRLFRPLLPADGIDTPEKFNKGWIERIPITGGAWKIKSFDKTGQTVSTVPDPNWWGPKPKLDSITWRALDQPADTEAYLNREIDEAPAILPEDYKRLAKAPGTDIRRGARWDEVHITLGDRGPLKDLKVRQAVDLATDRKGIVAAFAKDLDFPVQTLDNHFFMPNQAGYKANAGKWGTFDLDGARKLLDEAGWKDNGPGKPRTKGGQQLSLQYVISAGSSSSALDQAQIVQQQLGQAGFKINIQKVPTEDFSDKYLDRGDFDLTSFRNVDYVFHTQLYPTFRQPKGKQTYLNFGGIGSPEIDKLLGRAAGETDVAKSNALYNEADVKIWAEVHSIELYQRPQIYAVRAGLANFGASGLGDWDFVKMGWQK